MGELATFDEELPEKEKMLKQLWSLSHSFATLAMMSNLAKVGFESIGSAVETEAAHPKSPQNLQ